jgi:hypothetical protein
VSEHAVHHIQQLLAALAFGYVALEADVLHRLTRVVLDGCDGTLVPEGVPGRPIVDDVDRYRLGGGDSLFELGDRFGVRGLALEESTPIRAGAS